MSMRKNKPIRLVHLTTSLKIGGAETMLVDLVDRLREHQFEQQVICFYDGPNGERIRQLGVPVYQVKGLFCLYDPIFFVRLFLILRKLKPDCLHTLLWAANFAGRIIAHILGIPVVCALHNNSDQNGKLRICLDRLTISSSDRFIAVSEQVKNSFLNYIPAPRIVSIEVITNGIDAERCRNGAMQFQKKRSSLMLNEQNFVIGSVGRFVAIKNYPLLIDQLTTVVERYPHVRLVLIGTGPQEEYLKKKIRENRLEHYVNIIINQPALPYYLLFDCFILPSYKEGISMALLEAMSFGLPCIVGNHCSTHSVIQSGYNGLVVTPDQSFVQPLLILIERKRLRQSLSRGAKKNVKEHFSLEYMVKSYAELFCGLSNRI